MASENEPISSGATLLGMKLRTFCEQNGSVRSVANALQITPQQLQKYVRGAQKPGSDILAGLKRQGCDINWLIDDSEPIGSALPAAAPPAGGTASSSAEAAIDFAAVELVLGRSLEKAAVNFGATAEEVQAWKAGAEPPLEKLARLTNLILFVATDGRLQIQIPPSMLPDSSATDLSSDHPAAGRQSQAA